ncbi:hypothetical protein RCU70_17040 [Escherichia marmotae]|nr:hypothetical protein [Escherichia marmotae]
MASLEAEPVAWKATFTQIDHEYNTFTAMYSDKAEAERWVRLHKVGDFRAEITPLYAAPPAMVVPKEMYWQDAPVEGSSKAAAYATGWNSCRAAMLQSQGEGNPHVTPARLPGGFTIEDAKELHEDLVRSHISQALSGEKMKKKDRDADLRWIHGVIVQAAWFVKASLEALPEPLQEEKGGSANCTASHGTTDNPPVPGKQINELTMLVKQLVSQLKKAKPDCKLPDKAMDYLKRNGLISVEDILR